MQTKQSYEPTRHEIHDWQMELLYLQRKPAKREPERRRINALRTLIATHAKH